MDVNCMNRSTWQPPNCAVETGLPFMDAADPFLVRCFWFV